MTTTETNSAEEAPDSLAERVNNRSRRPSSDAFREFMGSQWGPRPDPGITRSAVADYLPARATAAGEPFAGERLVIPAGTYKVRSNDCTYRFRAYSAFAHLSGLGQEREPDSVIVLEPLPEGGHEAVLYFKPRTSRSSQEFYSDSRYGEFWVGARPSLEEVSTETGLRCEHIDTLHDALAKDAGIVRLRVVRNVDEAVEAMVNEVRMQAGLPFGGDAAETDDALEERLSEIRLCKDEFEISELQRAVEITKTGFEDILRSLPRAVGHRRGERVIEGAFGAVAREEGNGLGYDTIAASGNHANTLHWIDNDGPVNDGDLVLVDAGVEVDSLYTADITRPLPVSAEESLSPNGQQHRRWMPHGTSHHLGLDVHDCAQARREMYQDALLEPGMCFTIEPGLYFRADDMAIPEEFRGIGVRIEDDVLVNADGSVTRISEDIPRTIADVEAWIASAQGRA